MLKILFIKFIKKTRIEFWMSEKTLASVNNGKSNFIFKKIKK